MKKRLIVLFLGFLVVLSFLAFNNYFNITSEIKVKDLGEFKRENLIPEPSKKQKVGNITIVELEGTSYEIGYQNGALLKKEIGELLDEAFSRYLPSSNLKGRLVRIFVLGLVKKIDVTIPIEYRQEMQGVADGANRSYNDILLMNAFVDGFGGLSPLLLEGVLNVAGIHQGCSSVIVHKGSKSSDLIIGQTVDYLITLGAGHSVLYVVRKTGHKEIYLPSFPGVVLSINGMNEDGLVLTQRDTPSGQGRIGISMGVVARKLLEESADLDNARNYLSGIKWSISRSILIADSQNNLSSFFEVLPGKRVREVKIKEGYAGAANHYKTKEFREVQEKALKRCKKLKFICQYDDYITAYEGSLSREKHLEDYIKKETWATSEKIAEAISDYTPDSTKFGGMTVANRFTQQAIVFIPEKKVIYMANGKTVPVTEEGFVKINLKYKQ